VPGNVAATSNISAGITMCSKSYNTLFTQNFVMLIILTACHFYLTCFDRRMSRPCSNLSSSRWWFRRYHRRSWVSLQTCFVTSHQLPCLHRHGQCHLTSCHVEPVHGTRPVVLCQQSVALTINLSCTSCQKSRHFDPSKVVHFVTMMWQTASQSPAQHHQMSHSHTDLSWEPRTSPSDVHHTGHM